MNAIAAEHTDDIPTKKKKSERVRKKAAYMRALYRLRDEFRKRFDTLHDEELEREFPEEYGEQQSLF